MNKIENPVGISFSKSAMDSVKIIINDHLIKAKWNHTIIPGYGVDETLTLEDIARQLKHYDSTILVIHERPTSGAIYRWNNYDDSYWYQVGTMEGYA